MIAGVLLAAAAVLNNASPLYFIHVVPGLVVSFGALFSQGADLRGGDALEILAGRVVAGALDPYAAADELVAGVTA